VNEAKELTILLKISVNIFIEFEVPMQVKSELTLHKILNGIVPTPDKQFPVVASIKSKAFLFPIVIESPSL